MASTSFVLRPSAPFRLDLTVWVLRRRPDNVMDRWDGETYRRTLALRVPDGPDEPGVAPVDVAVRQTAPPESPRLHVTVMAAEAYPRSVLRADVTAVLDRLLGLSVDLTGYYQMAAADARLAPLADRFRGFKPPRFPTLFECLCNAIVCQQITLLFGLRVLSRLTAAYGSPATVEEPTSAGAGTSGTTCADRGYGAGPAHAFPTPERLAAAEPSHLRTVGLSRQKIRALLDLARVSSDEQGRLGAQNSQGGAGGSLEAYRAALEDQDDAAVVAWLRRLWGVGRWTAEYTLLRGLGRLHVFPGDDVGARNNLQHWLRLPGPLDYDGVRRVIADWAPYGGLVYFSLLLDHLATQGWLGQRRGA